jgi:hypothetical protein
MRFTRLQTKEQRRFEELLFCAPVCGRPLGLCARDSVVLPERGHDWMIE